MLACRSFVTALLALFATLCAVSSAAQEHVTFPTQDGGLVYADLYGQSERGVVLAHGGTIGAPTNNSTKRANRHIRRRRRAFVCWRFDFRGHGESRGLQGKSGGGDSGSRGIRRLTKSRSISSRIFCEQTLSLRNEPAGTYVTRFCGLLSTSAPGCEFAKPDLSDHLGEFFAKLALT